MSEVVSVLLSVSARAGGATMAGGASNEDDAPTADGFFGEAARRADDFLGDGPGASRLYLRPAVLSPSAVRPLEMSVRDIAWSGILAAHIIGKKAAYQSLTRRATGSTTT